MKLELVTGTPFQIICIRCDRRQFAGDGRRDKTFADLDGKPFEAYYCEDCAQRIEDAMSDTRKAAPWEREGKRPIEWAEGKAAHTPGPWKLTQANTPDPASFRWVIGVEGVRLASLPRFSNEDEANAELIVRAVNSHDALLAAAEAALAALMPLGPDSESRHNKAAAQLQAAISAARGQS